MKMASDPLTSDYMLGRRSAERGCVRLPDQGSDWLAGYDSVFNGSHIIGKPENKEEQPVSVQHLENAREIISGGRQTTHGKPERSFEHIAKRWSLTVGTDITPRQVALMMADLKLVRLLEGVTTEGADDHIVDMIGYIALASEL